MGVDDSDGRGATRGPEVRARGDPDIHPVADGDAGIRRVDVGSAALVELAAGVNRIGPTPERDRGSQAESKGLIWSSSY